MKTRKDELEQDLELKLRFMRWLWTVGYLPRKNLNLPNLDLPRRGQSYTDVDVFGIRFDETLSPSIIVADCKTGKSTGKYERYFWLNGVMKYFGATEGFFIRDKINYRDIIEISRQLDIIPLSLSRLRDMERIYNINKSMFFGPFSQDQKKIDDAYKIIRNKNRAIEEYIRFKLWADPPNQQLLTLSSCCKEIDNLSDIEKRVKTFAVAYTLTMFSIALLGFTRRVLFVSDERKEEYIKQALLGGKIESGDRKKLLYSFYDFMAQEIKERYKQKYPISRAAFIDGMIPSYAKYLYDLVIRIQNNPRNAIYMPRILDYIGHKILFDEPSYRIAEIIPTEIIVDKHRFLRPVIDLLTFVERGQILSSTTIEVLKGTVRKIEEKKNSSMIFNGQVDDTIKGSLGGKTNYFKNP